MRLPCRHWYNFNPRSLAGATSVGTDDVNNKVISIHAPSRERPVLVTPGDFLIYISIHAPSRERPLITYQSSTDSDFNPRSLAGATGVRPRQSNKLLFQSTLPRGSDQALVRQAHPASISIHAPSRERQHQNELLLYSFKSSIFCELAQLKYSKIYFDVRKLIVSHSSLSCEPKLNFMFHITSHHEPKLHKR